MVRSLQPFGSVPFALDRAVHAIPEFRPVIRPWKRFGRHRQLKEFTKWLPALLHFVNEQLPGRDCLLHRLIVGLKSPDQLRPIQASSG